MWYEENNMWSNQTPEPDNDFGCFIAVLIVILILLFLFFTKQ